MGLSLVNFHSFGGMKRKLGVGCLRKSLAKKMMLNKGEARQIINNLAYQKEPFLFIIDYDCNKNIVLPLSEVDASKILFDLQGVSNIGKGLSKKKHISLEVSPVGIDTYQKAFNRIESALKLGNTYLANLTFETPINTSSTLLEIFASSKAKYKLWYDDKFVVFSPETFIQINDNEISSFPMKGTIDASIPNAKKTLLENKKELAEHVTIVDLIRNDMSIYANHVAVDKFRYIDEIKTNGKTLLQISSEIKGLLKPNTEMGDLIFSLLPAGSITGAPKRKTIEILSETENYARGYYTGVFGVFDGSQLDSGVMIRFIEKQGEKMVYKSGGGIHVLSDGRAEYQELIDKIYVPVY